MPRESPLPVLAENRFPLPKLAGPVNPVYASMCAPPAGPVSITAADGMISDQNTVDPECTKVSPVKFMAPLPFAKRLDPTCSSVTE